MENSYIKRDSKFAIVVEKTFDAIFINDANGNYLYANQRASEISGYSNEELLHMNIVDLSPLERIESVKTRIQNRLIGQESLNLFDFNLLHKNGTKIPVEITAAALEWEGKPAEMVSLRDISKRKDLATELEYLSQFQNILLHLGERFISFPLDTINEVINQALETVGEFTQIDRVYVFDYDFKKGIMTNTHEWCAKGISSEMKNLQAVPNASFPEWVAAHKQGNQIYIPCVKKLPLHSELRKILESQKIQSIITIPLMLQKQAVGFVGFDSVRKEKQWSEKEASMLKYFANLLANVKEHARTEKALVFAKEKAVESELVKSSFLQTMSHELRTPLNAIIGFSDLIDKEMPLETILEYCKIINQSGEHLLEMLTNIFDLSLLVAGEVTAKYKPTNLLLLANEINTKMLLESNKSDKKNITYKWEFPENIESVTAFMDAPKLKKIIEQLLNNAIKFTLKGEIIFGFEIIEHKKAILYYVKDTGIGIPKGKQKIIFNIFRQADGGNTRLYGGMGIGLSLAKKLTDLLRGKIWFETKEGVGSVFYLNIPLRTNSL